MIYSYTSLVFVPQSVCALCSALRWLVRLLIGRWMFDRSIALHCIASIGFSSRWQRRQYLSRTMTAQIKVIGMIQHLKIHCSNLCDTLATTKVHFVIVHLNGFSASSIWNDVSICVYPLRLLPTYTRSQIETETYALKTFSVICNTICKYVDFTSMS